MVYISDQDDSGAVAAVDGLPVVSFRLQDGSGAVAAVVLDCCC